MDNNIYGPGDDDYGRNPRFGPSKDNPPPIKMKSYMPEPEPSSLWGTVRPYSEKVEKFIKWVAYDAAYWPDENIYVVFHDGTDLDEETSFDTLDELYEYWEEFIYEE